MDAYRTAFESGAWLGARYANTLCRDADGSRLADNLACFAELAAEFGLRPLVEFMAVSDIDSIAGALELIERSGAGNLALEVDALHLVRTGGTPAELKRLPRRMIERAQINDGPLVMPKNDWRFEALQQRRIPGEGQFPLVELVRALPANVHLGVEVPLQDLKDRGVSGRERVRLAVEGARRVIAAAMATD